jgi:hypothetical protein
MRDRKDKGRIHGPFVPWLIDTSNAPAWLAMSAHARVVYMALKARYSIKARNNGRIYLSVRQAAKETGFSKNTAARCLRELACYGFIVMTNPGCLGVDGKGKAPHWRLTELGYMTDPPTRDFLKWDGVIFHEQRKPGYYTRKARQPRTGQATDGEMVHLDMSHTYRQAGAAVCPTRRDSSPGECPTRADTGMSHTCRQPVPRDGTGSCFEPPSEKRPKTAHDS